MFELHMPSFSGMSRIAVLPYLSIPTIPITVRYLFPVDIPSSTTSAVYAASERKKIPQCKYGLLHPEHALLLLAALDFDLPAGTALGNLLEASLHAAARRTAPIVG
mmetsp:Transcript_26596/g.54055  ORF Transcript_26596/g.54055 Transcript_26596/m.54055 type:complete len:106 (-) Transcript_26596:709-1026(-)